MISIIVPIYNSARYIERCLNSIISQTYLDWELILVNDGSTDNSEEKILPYLNDGRIRLFSKENGGVSRARNYGIHKSKGEYVLFLDSDDWLADNTCERLINVMHQKSSDCVVFGFKQTHGHIWAPEYDKDYYSLNEFKNDFDYWLNTELLSSSVNKMYKRSRLISFFPPDMSFGEDLVFSLTYISGCTSISFIKDPLYQHEVYNTTSLTHTFDSNRFVDIERIQTTIINFASIVTNKTYNKYCLDVIRLVRMMIRQKNMSYKYKRDILEDWKDGSYFQALDIKQYRWPFRDYMYAKMIQLGQWRLLDILHTIKNAIKGIR